MHSEYDRAHLDIIPRAKRPFDFEYDPRSSMRIPRPSILSTNPARKRRTQFCRVNSEYERCNAARRSGQFNSEYKRRAEVKRLKAGRGILSMVLETWMNPAWETILSTNLASRCDSQSRLANCEYDRRDSARQAGEINSEYECGAPMRRLAQCLERWPTWERGLSGGALTYGRKGF